MKKKFGFDGTGYRSRSREKIPSEQAALGDELTAAFKAATGAAAKAAWSEGHSIPAKKDGRLVNIAPNGKVQELKSGSN